MVTLQNRVKLVPISYSIWHAFHIILYLNVKWRYSCYNTIATDLVTKGLNFSTILPPSDDLPETGPVHSLALLQQKCLQILSL